jgi:hypothetical protein
MFHLKMSCQSGLVRAENCTSRQFNSVLISRVDEKVEGSHESLTQLQC